MKIYKKSNCKINLNLKIVGIKDGYHMLESVFCPISLYDDMTIEKDTEDIVVGMNIPLESNIIYKTIKLFKEKYNIKEGVKVTINKNVPMQAGLGGGSSNAAFTIIGMNELFDLGLSNDEMIEFGKQIGSDVPFFIINKPSFVQGRGEIIQPLEKFDKIYGVLVFDDIYMSTKEVFNVYDSIINKQETENDLEQAVVKIENGNKICDIKKFLLGCGCKSSLMSGAGGSVFGLCNKEELEGIYNKVSKKYLKTWKFESI